jgi:hypothetical protein
MSSDTANYGLLLFPNLTALPPVHARRNCNGGVCPSFARRGSESPGRIGRAGSAFLSEGDHGICVPWIFFHWSG